MKSHFSLSGGVAMACAITGATAMMTDVCSGQTFVAADYATNSAYADGWQDTDNGGFGFTHWSFNGTYTSATQHAMNTNSPYNQLGVAWTLYLPNGKPPMGQGQVDSPNPPEDGGDLSRAGRGFPPLQVGQTISTVIDNPTERHFYNGYTINLITGTNCAGFSPSCTGFSRLRVGTFEYFTMGRWYVDSVEGGSPSLFDTNTAAAGMRLDVTLTGPNNYQLVMTPLNNPANAYTNAGTLKGSGPIDWIQFEHYNTDSDFYDENGPQVATDPKATDLYIRSITITEVQALAPNIIQQPLPQTLYPGRNARFSVGAIGTALGYSWRKDGFDLSNGGNISGALTDTLVVSNVSLSDVAAYTVLVTNLVGAVTSAPPANLTLIQPSGSPYEAAVRAAQPIAYWRLNETTNPTNKPTAFDYWGGFVGTYGNAAQNGFNGITGPRAPDFTGLESDNEALQSTAGTPQSWVTIPPLNLNTNALSFVLWVNPNSDTITPYSGLIYTRRGSTSAAGVQYTDANQIGYTVNNDITTYSFDSGLITPSHQWSFVAVVIEPSQATIYLDNTNGQASAVNVNDHANVVWDGIGFIGGDPDNSVGRTFDGKIDEVAVFNYALTPEQVLSLYNASLSVGVSLSIQKVGGNIVLSWPKGKLLEATNLNGPWVTNNAASPYTNSPTGLRKFYRLGN